MKRCKDCNGHLNSEGKCDGKSVWYTMTKTFCDTIRILKKNSDKK